MTSEEKKEAIKRKMARSKKNDARNARRRAKNQSIWKDVKKAFKRVKRAWFPTPAQRRYDQDQWFRIWGA